MSRLPQPGSDAGTWGSILNEFLTTSHNPDGSLKADVVTTTQLASASVDSSHLSTTVQSAIANAYTKPASGIPKSDLSLSVQQSLNNADAAVGGSVSDATATSKGIVKLAGSLAGTADAPLLANASVTAATIAGGVIDTSKLTSTLQSTIASAYKLPSGGIARNDLAANVQQSLDNADAAVSGTVPEASSTTKGTVRLTGALAGTADSPALANGSVTDAAISSTAAIQQSKISGLSASLSALEPAITAGSTTQYLRGDKTFQTLNKAAVGLGNVDNTSDANKPISTSVQAALDAKIGTSDTRLTDQRTPGDGSVTTAKLADNAVTEAKLSIANSPASGQVLGWNGAAMAWSTPASGSGSSSSPVAINDVTGNVVVYSTDPANRGTTDTTKVVIFITSTQPTAMQNNDIWLSSLNN